MFHLLVTWSEKAGRKETVFTFGTRQGSPSHLSFTFTAGMLPTSLPGESEFSAASFEVSIPNHPSGWDFFSVVIIGRPQGSEMWAPLEGTWPV